MPSQRVHHSRYAQNGNSSANLNNNAVANRSNGQQIWSEPVQKPTATIYGYDHTEGRQAVNEDRPETGEKAASSYEPDIPLPYPSSSSSSPGSPHTRGMRRRRAHSSATDEGGGPHEERGINRRDRRRHHSADSLNGRGREKGFAAFFHKSFMRTWNAARIKLKLGSSGPSPLPPPNVPTHQEPLTPRAQPPQSPVRTRGRKGGIVARFGFPTTTTGSSKQSKEDEDDSPVFLEPIVLVRDEHRERRREREELLTTSRNWSNYNNNQGEEEQVSSEQESGFSPPIPQTAFGPSFPTPGLPYAPGASSSSACLAGADHAQSAQVLGSGYKSVLSWRSQLQQNQRVRPQHMLGRGIRFLTGSDEIAMPDHGDDAIGIGPYWHVVCDGVGGTATTSAPFARLLVMGLTSALSAYTTNRGSSLEEQAVDPEQLREVVETSIMKSVRACLDAPEMASTISIAYFERKGPTEVLLHCFTLGDSKTIVIRNKALAYESVSIVLGFNYPLSMNNCMDSQRLRLSQMRYDTFHLRRGDVVLSFSDGIHDNLFVDEVLNVVHQYRKEGPKMVASALAKYAKLMTRRIPSELNPVCILSAKAYFSAVKRKCASSAAAGAFKPSKADLEYLQDAKEVLKQTHTSRAVFEAELKVGDGNEYYTFDLLKTHAQRRTGKDDDISVCVTILE